MVKAGIGIALVTACAQADTQAYAKIVPSPQQAIVSQAPHFSEGGCDGTILTGAHHMRLNATSSHPDIIQGGQSTYLRTGTHSGIRLFEDPGKDHRKRIAIAEITTPGMLSAKTDVVVFTCPSAEKGRNAFLNNVRTAAMGSVGHIDLYTVSAKAITHTVAR